MTQGCIAGCPLEKWYLHVLRFQNTVRDVDSTVKRIHEVKAQYTVGYDVSYTHLLAILEVANFHRHFTTTINGSHISCSSLQLRNSPLLFNFVDPSLDALLYDRQTGTRVYEHPAWRPFNRAFDVQSPILAAKGADLNDLGKGITDSVRPAATRFPDIAMTNQAQCTCYILSLTSFNDMESSRNQLLS